jgi:hypothetical protein
MNPLTAQFWIGIGIAALCGGIIGFERQIRGKPAGIRTSILICLGTSIFVHLGTTFGGANVDPTRVLGQVVTGDCSNVLKMKLPAAPQSEIYAALRQVADAPKPLWRRCAAGYSGESE